MHSANLAKSLNIIEQKIDAAAKKSGRIAPNVKLVAISKKQSLEKMESAYSLGIRDFGENYVQEFLPKRRYFIEKKLSDICWHFVGHLQSNKVNSIAGNFFLIHSVSTDSVLAAFEKKMTAQKVLVEVNLAGEESKAGIAPENLRRFLEETVKLNGVQICGLTFMPPLNWEADQYRSYFEKARFLRDKMAMYVSLPHHLEELSMGTSADYEYAIEQGATLIRIGTALFGNREE